MSGLVVSDCRICGVSCVDTAYGAGHLKAYDMKVYRVHAASPARRAVESASPDSGPSRSARSKTNGRDGE